MCWTQKVEDAGPGAAHGNGEVADNEVASHPLIANLFQEICAENPDRLHKSRQGSSGSSQSDLDARRAARRSTSGLAQSLQQEFGSEEAETPEVEVRTEVSCAELTQAKKWVVSDSIGQRVGCLSSLGHSKEGSHIHSGGKTGGTEEGVPARAQAELDKTMLDASRDVAGKHRQLLTRLPCSFSQCLQLETAGGVLARHR